MQDFDSQASLDNLTEDELQRQFTYVERRISNGLKNGDSFDLLEAESTLLRIGSFEPGPEVADLVLERISQDDYHADFDVLRLSGYLKNDKILSVLERRFEELTRIWKAQDDIRLAESYKTMLANVSRRAGDLNALKVRFDPYVSTLDEFFNRSFNQRAVERFPKLAEIRDELYELRKDGALSKDNIISVLGVAQDRISTLVDQQLKELNAEYGGQLPKPNRVIAIYYCLLEALMSQESARVTVDEEFLDKIYQDFRAAIGHGTKRFVLNSLLRLNHPGFAEIAAEARYSLRPSAIEKAERKDEGDKEFKYEKVDLSEMQIYELYKTAAEVIARNPVDEVFHSLLHSYNVASLLLGLRALRMADIPAARKLKHLTVLLDLGTVNEYVFIRAVDTLAHVDSPGARSLLVKLIAERYGWRKVRIPESAFDRLIEGVRSARTSGDITAIASNLIPADRRQEVEDGEDLTYPFEAKVYDRVLDAVASRFEKNPFHGVGEMAQFALFRTLLLFVTRTHVDFALPAKRRALAAIRRMGQVSRDRHVAMLTETKAAYDFFAGRREQVPQNKRSDFQSLLTELKKTLSQLTAYRGAPPLEEAELRELPKKLFEYHQRRMRGENGQRLREYLGHLVSLGPVVMNNRDRNIRRTAKYQHLVDETMLTVRYPAASRTLMRCGSLLREYVEDTGEELARRLLDSFNLDTLPSGLAINKRIPDEKKTEAVWENLRPALMEPLTYEQLLTRRMFIALATAGAAEHGLQDILRGLAELLYDAGQPEEARLAMLLFLPLESSCADIWRKALCCETEAVLLVLRSELGEKGCRRLREIVPELLDLLEWKQ